MNALKDYFLAIVKERDRHEELKNTLATVLADYECLAAQAGIKLKFSLSVPQQSEPQATHVCIEIQKDRWPFRRLFNVKVRENDEKATSNFRYYLRYRIGGRLTNMGINHAALRRTLEDNDRDQKELTAAISEFICQKILTTSELNALQEVTLRSDRSRADTQSDRFSSHCPKPPS